MKGNEFDGKVIGITRPAERVAEAVNMVEAHGGKGICCTYSGTSSFKFPVPDKTVQNGRRT